MRLRRPDLARRTTIGDALAARALLVVTQMIGAPQERQLRCCVSASITSAWRAMWSLLVSAVRLVVLIQIGAATVVAAHLAHVLLRDRLEDFPHRGVERAATDGAACRGFMLIPRCARSA